MLLLRLLCGLGRPTTGRIDHHGRISALLELGSGLHLDMTGRENIMTAGILNGLTKNQVLAKQDEIIAFSELEEFIDQPIRTYSTGMYLRLAFSAAIQFDPDILMIDEVLAVGDSRFQGKCLDRLYAFQRAGKTARLWLLSAGRYYVNLGLYPIDWSYVYDFHWQMHLFHIGPDRGMSADTSGIISINPVWTFFPNGRRTSA